LVLLLLLLCKGYSTEKQSVYSCRYSKPSNGLDSCAVCGSPGTVLKHHSAVLNLSA